MLIKNSNQRTRENIRSTLNYFEKECIKEHKIIKGLVIEKIQSRYNKGFMYSIRIDIDTENSKNPYLKDSYFIIFSRTGKISKLSLFTYFKYYNNRNNLKRLLNKHYLKSRI